MEMLQGGSITALKERLDDALHRCGSSDNPTQHKTRVVTRHQNGTILMELDSAAAVDWFSHDDTWKQFFEGLHPSVIIRHHSFHAVIHFVPLTF